MKLAAFDFEVVYEPGTSNPCDYGSRHPPAVAKGQEEAARQEQGKEGPQRALCQQVDPGSASPCNNKETAKEGDCQGRDFAEADGGYHVG